MSTPPNLADLFEPQPRLAEHAYPPTNREPMFIERYSHGGMSSGYVSPQFWFETAFPLLRSRYLNVT